MTKQTMRWKIEKEMRAASVLKQSAQRTNDRGKELLADGMLVAFQAVMKLIDEYKDVEKEYKERRAKNEL